MKFIAVWMPMMLLFSALAGCSGDAPDAQGRPESGDPSSSTQPETESKESSNGSLTMRGPGAWKQDASPSHASASPQSSPAPASSSPPASAPSSTPASTSETPPQNESAQDEPQQVEGRSWDPMDLGAWTTIPGQQVGLAGYRYSASIEDGDLALYEIDVQIGQVETTSLRSLALSPGALQSYIDQGGDMTDPSGGVQILASAPVLESSASVIPVRHIVNQIEGDQVVAQSIVTLWIPLQAEPPEGFWNVAALHYDDGTHEGSWEYALGAQPPGDSVVVPYMAGDSMESYAALDIFLALYGLRIYAAYPDDDDPIPAIKTEVDAEGYLFPKNSSDPDDEGFTVSPQGLVMVMDEATGQQLPFEAVSIEHREETDGQEQMFRLVLSTGSPLPQEIGVQVSHPDTGQVQITLKLESISSGLPGLPNLEDVPGLLDEYGGALPKEELPSMTP